MHDFFVGVQNLESLPIFEYEIWFYRSFLISVILGLMNQTPTNISLFTGPDLPFRKMHLF
jgi:hypothetical protein